jgi:hypothetical protein
VLHVNVIFRSACLSDSLLLLGLISVLFVLLNFYIVSSSLDRQLKLFSIHSISFYLIRVFLRCDLFSYKQRQRRFLLRLHYFYYFCILNGPSTCLIFSSLCWIFVTSLIATDFGEWVWFSGGGMLRLVKEHLILLFN